MAVLESRPFLAPSRSAVHVDVSLIEPATEIERISELWETGRWIVLRLRATLEDDFWEQTSILRDEPVLLVGLVTCLPARANWRRDSTFRLHDGIWEAETLVEVDGSVATVELIADAWIVGPGRTGSQDPSTAIHAGAKLWQTRRPPSSSHSRATPPLSRPLRSPSQRPGEEMCHGQSRSAPRRSLTGA